VTAVTEPIERPSVFRSPGAGISLVT